MGTYVCVDGHASCIQSCVALISVEAELIALTRGLNSLGCFSVDSAKERSHVQDLKLRGSALAGVVTARSLPPC
eukprot:4423481-Amphidinium_carterae.2